MLGQSFIHITGYGLGSHNLTDRGRWRWRLYVSCLNHLSLLNIRGDKASFGSAGVDSVVDFALQIYSRLCLTLQRAVTVVGFAIVIGFVLL